MSLVLDAIAEKTARLTRLVPTPLAPFGYGVDLSCVTDLTEDMAEVDPFSYQGIAESVLRFLISDRDSIPDAPGRGHNLRRLLNRAMTALELQAEEGLIETELEQDDRITAADATLTVAGRRVVVRLKLTPNVQGLDLFTFTVAVEGDGKAFLEGLKA